MFCEILNRETMAPMRITKLSLTLAALAVLALSACSGASEVDPTNEQQSPAPATSTPTGDSADQPPTSADAVDPVDQTTAPVTAPVDTPSQEPVDQSPEAKEFTDKLRAAMSSQEHVLQKMNSGTSDQPQTSINYIDLTDRQNPRQYSVVETPEGKFEAVLEDGTLYSRSGDSEWVAGDQVDAEDFLDSMAPTVLELEQNDSQTYSVKMIPSASGADDVLQAKIVVDDQFRATSMELDFQGSSVTATYDYETTMEIPAVN